VKCSAKVVDGGDPLSADGDLLRAAEARRKQEVLLAARLQDLMDEEAAMSKDNMKKIQNRWLEVLRVEKFQELKGEIDILRNGFEKTLDRKNAVIQMLASDLDEAEEQYRLAMRTHLGNIDALIDLQHRRATDLENQFEDELLRLKKEFETERSEIQAKHAIEKADLKLILANMKAEADKQDRDLEEETSQSRDTAIEKMEQERNGMRTEMETQVQAVREKIQSLYSKFDSHMTSSMRDYMDKTKEDEASAKEIETKMKKIQKLQESIATMKSNLSNNIRECEERNSAMKAEKDTIARHFKDLKLKMHAWRKKEEAHLAELVTNAKKTKTELEEKAAQAQRILRAVELCAQLETEREKVLRFDADVTTSEVARDVAARVKKYVEEQALTTERGATDVVTMQQMLALEDDADISASAAEEWKLMERFWLRYNKVVLDNAAIEQERFHLQNENEKLRSLLKQYLDGISVNPEVMAGANNLLQTAKIRGIGTVEEARKAAHAGRGPGTVTDGNKVYAEVARQRM